MAWGSKGRSALTTAGTAGIWGVTAGTAESWGVTAGTAENWGVTAGSWGVTAGTAGTGSGIEMEFATGCGLCILAGNVGIGRGLICSTSILLDARAGAGCSLAKSMSILKLGDTMVGLTRAGMNLSFSASLSGAGAATIL